LKQHLTTYIYLIYFYSCFSALHSQNLTLKISVKDSINAEFIENLKFKEKHLNKESLFFQIDSLTLMFEKIGFLDAKLDTVVQKDSNYNAQFTLGNSIKKIKIYYDQNSIDKETIQRISNTVTDTFFEIKFDLLENKLNALTSHFEEKGHSFIEIYLNNFNVSKNRLSAKLNIENFKIRKVNKIITKGIENFPKSFIIIKNYFSLDNENIFSKKNLSKISNQTKALSFVSESKPPEVLFTNDSTFVYLYLDKKKSNTFDGLIGFSSSEENNSLQFNGYLDVALNNLFNGGENISLNWKNNGNEKQLFNLSVETPYIFNSPITPKIDLNIYKQDSSFINTTATIQLKYAINYKNTIGLSYMSESSSNLLNNSINTFNDYTTELFGITYSYRVHSNSALFPTKLNTLVKINTGSRKSNPTKTNQTKLNISADYTWNLNRKNKLYSKSNNAILFSENYLTNELFRIGGVTTIRGFDEESIFSTSYSILNIEYRHLTNNTSYLYSFSDFAYIQNNLEELNQNIYSLGLGYAFKTNFGLLDLSYALGKPSKSTFDFNNSRLHLKIISSF